MPTEKRQDLIPMVVIEYDRQMRERQDNAPDVLILHPIDAQELYSEIHHNYPWASAPPASEVAYRQFYGMDIMENEKMTAGFFVVGRRRPIKVWAVDGPPPTPQEPKHE